jgi:hypothetical protein
MLGHNVCGTHGILAQYTEIKKSQQIKPYADI